MSNFIRLESLDCLIARNTMSVSLSFNMRILLFLCLLLSSVSAQWQTQNSNTTADFRGLSVVSEKIVWASGTKGTFVRTTDGGMTWQPGVVPGAEALDFRDVEAFDANTAFLLSIGNGDSSRIYKTTDGGRNWALQFKNEMPGAFFDALAFWDRDHGIALSDPVNGRFLLIATNDGGASWQPLPSDRMPPAVSGEGGFAASGTCLITRGKNDVWFVSGGMAARVFHSTDRGRSWRVTNSPVLSGIESAGIFSIAFSDSRNGIVVGGDYRRPEAAVRHAAVTRDGGNTWKLLEGSSPGGFRSAAMWLRQGKESLLLTVGTSGADLSVDGGRTWRSTDRENYNATGGVRNRQGQWSAWAVGPKGRIALYSPHAAPSPR